MKSFYQKAASLALVLGLALPLQAKTFSLLNVSYDPTRELYQEYNEAFAKHWKAKTGNDVKVRQSHGGSGSQARAVIDGLPADVVTLALAGDIDPIAERAKTLPRNWNSLLPHNSAPYTSTIVFLVRKGNPKGIKDWNDLVKPGISVVTPNPKTSGGARWNYLAAWLYALKQPGGNAQKAQDFVGKLYGNVPVLDRAARAGLTTFAERGIGDVFLSWENEAYLAVKTLEKGKFEIVVPSLSVLAEPSVAVNEAVAKKKGNYEVAKAYLEYLYSKEGQEIAAKHSYRPRDKEVAARYKDFVEVKLYTIEELGGWTKVTKEHFADGGIFDQIYKR